MVVREVHRGYLHAAHLVVSTHRLDAVKHGHSMIAEGVGKTCIILYVQVKIAQRMSKSGGYLALVNQPFQNTSDTWLHHGQFR